MISLKKRNNSQKTEIIRYIIIGGCTTFLNLIIFIIMCKFLYLDITLSNFVSIFVSIIFAYITNKLFVFQSHCKGLLDLFFEACKFGGARFLTMIIEIVGVFLLVNIIGQDELIGKIETQVIVLISNYIISKFLVFKNVKNGGEKDL